VFSAKTKLISQPRYGTPGYVPKPPILSEKQTESVDKELIRSIWHDAQVTLADAVNVAALFLTNSCMLSGPCPAPLKQSADPSRMRGALEQLSIWLGRATEEGRAALNSLRTSTTEANDLAEAFRRAIEECRIENSMEASFSVVGETREMHPIVRDEVYRIGYEAIRNACVHSQAN
jgi:glucose-6-phosphate-specific signal transduction histidine kinase